MGKGARNRAAHALTREQAIALLSQPDVRKEFDRQVGIELQKRADEFYEAELAMIIWSIRKTYGFGGKTAPRLVQQLQATFRGTGQVVRRKL